MSTTTTTESQLRESLTYRLRQAATGAAFTIRQLQPRIRQLRQNPRAWLAVRVTIGALGAALVVLPLSFGNFLILPVLGLGLFLAATLLPPTPYQVSDDEIAHELGARLVLEAGDYQAGSVLGFPAKIFVGADELWVLDPMHRTLAVIPIAEIGSANAEETAGKWALRICWKTGDALFAYDGVFAGRLAKIAQDTIRTAKAAVPSLAVPDVTGLPEVPDVKDAAKARAASA